MSDRDPDATAEDEPDSDEKAESDDETKPEGGFAADPDRVALLREVADDVRGETSESKQLSNVLYRVSDLYDEAEDTSPEEILRNVKFILEVNERGGLAR